jgi:UDP-GlcNAc:undecaprenyl-phosphate GlcNAc-1-phosphate transferase
MNSLFDYSLTALFIHLGFAMMLVVISALITLFMLHRVRIMDSPNDRSSHLTPVPKSGGTAIVSTFIIGMGLNYWFGNEMPASQKHVTAFLLATMIIAVVSFYDDIRDKSFKVKLVAQLCAAAAMLSAGLLIHSLPFPGFGAIPLGWPAYPVTVLWLIGLTNSYNFMDGIDGLAGGTAVLTCFFFGFISLQQGNSFTYTASLTVAAGSLGFLLFNWSPARIFMGDAGSAFLGFFFAATALIAAHYEHSYIPFPVMPLLLFHFIFDTAVTFFRRLLRGEAVTQAHRSHLYQLFNQLGGGHRNVSLCLFGMNILQGIGALYMVSLEESSQLLVFLPFLVLQSLYAIIILRKAKEERLI